MNGVPGVKLVKCASCAYPADVRSMFRFVSKANALYLCRVCLTGMQAEQAKREAAAGAKA